MNGDLISVERRSDVHVANSSVVEFNLNEFNSYSVSSIERVASVFNVQNKGRLRKGILNLPYISRSEINARHLLDAV